ncbi:MAG: DUF7544 domain-containing protein [Armatimonadota bacterium]
MNSSIVSDSIKDAWARTHTLLLTDRDVGRWLKYGLIAMLGAPAVGAAGNVNFQFPMSFSGGDGDGWSGPGSVGTEAADVFVNAVTWLGANIANIILLAAGLVTVWLVLWLAFLYVRSVFRFIFVDAIAAPREPKISGSWSRHTAHGLSLLLWNLLLGLVPLLLIVIALIPILSSIGLLASGEPLGAALGVTGMIGLIALIVLGLMLLALGRALTDDFLVPAMYAGRCGVFAGWRRTFRAWRGEAGNVVLFYLLKLLLMVGAAIVTSIVGVVAVFLLIVPALSMGIVTGLVLLSGTNPATAALVFGGPALVTAALGFGVFGYVLDVVLLPISVLFQSYSLAFVGRLDPSLRTI